MRYGWERLLSPVVIGTVILATTAAVQAFAAIPNPNWVNVTLIILGWAGAVVGAVNDPTNKGAF